MTALALLTIAVSGGLIMTFGQTAKADFVGDARRAWNTPYDLLVRPANSQTPLETRAGLVRSNFIAGIHGGITPEQLEVIRAISGVDVAAPIAIVGYVNWPSFLSMPLPNTVDGVYHASVTSIGEDGLSSYPIDDRYVVVSEHGTMVQTTAHFDFALYDKGGRVDCQGGIACFAPLLCGSPACPDPSRNWAGLLTSQAAYELYVMQPLLIAGIDPVAEAKLAGIDSCVRSGHYLRATDGPTDLSPSVNDDLERIPVLASNRSFVDETLTVSLSRAVDGDRIFSGAKPAQLREWSALSHESHTIDQLYQDFVNRTDWADPYPIWSAGDVTYEDGGQDRVRPTPLDTNLAIYRQLQGSIGDAGPEVLIPPAARDVGFRDVAIHGDGYIERPGSEYRLKKFEAVGTYDPTCIPGWDPLAGGKLDAYSYPVIDLADGRQLTPTRAMGGYLNSPPLLLTTLKSADWLSDPKRFKGQPGHADISAIRIKVQGVERPSDAAEAQLQRVALAIEGQTGLQVDVVKGSSLTSVAVELPAGRYGRPAEIATEGWSKKGVVIRVVQGVETESLALIAIAFGVAAAFAATTSFAAVRRRRREFAVLRALGWPALRLAALVELEVLAIGGGVAVLLCLGGIVSGRLFSPDLTANLVWQALLVVGVSAAAGVVPALSAYRGTAIEGIRGRYRLRDASAPQSIKALAFRELVTESPIEAGLAIAMLATGIVVASLTTLISVAFNGSLDLTILGTHIAARAEPYQLVLAALVLVLAAIENAQLLMLTYIEKSERLAVLGAVGWPRSAVTRLVAWQGLQLAVGGAALGAFVSVVIGSLTSSPWWPMLVSVLVGAGAGFAATIVAQIGVWWRIRTISVVGSVGV